MSNEEGNLTIALYLKDIEQYKLLTTEEEQKLAKKIQECDDGKAREEFILCNLRLVVKIANDYKNLGLPIADLIEEGNIGLMTAVERYKPGKGAKFSTYASWWIKQGIRRALSTTSRNIRIPSQANFQLSQIRKACAYFNEKLGRDPSNEELAKRTGMSFNSVKNLMMSAHQDTVSLNSPVNEESFMENIIPDSNWVPAFETLNKQDVIIVLEKLLNELKPREKQIIILRYGLNKNPAMTLEEVSIIIGRTRERIRQIQKDAERKLACRREIFIS